MPGHAFSHTPAPFQKQPTMRDKSVDTLPKNGPFLHSGYTYPLPLSTPTPSPQNQC